MKINLQDIDSRALTPRRRASPIGGRCGKGPPAGAPLCGGATRKKWPPCASLTPPAAPCAAKKAPSPHGKQALRACALCRLSNYFRCCCRRLTIDGVALLCRENLLSIRRPDGASQRRPALLTNTTMNYELKMYGFLLCGCVHKLQWQLFYSGLGAGKLGAAGSERLCRPEAYFMLG